MNWLTPQVNLEALRKHYIASGKGGYGKTTEGDNKTPLGVYTITGERKDSTLPDLYGSGALTLDYPNALDRQLGKTGEGIWIHGVPHAQLSRAPRSSEGCVTMSNEHMTTLMSQITPSETLVVLAHGLSYADNTKRSIQQQKFRTLFENFQTSLSKGNQVDKAALFEKNKHHHARSHLQTLSGEIGKIDSKDITIIMNPGMGPNHPVGERRTVMMQGYFGNENERQITLYWREQADGNWRIVTETLIAPKT